VAEEDRRVDAREDATTAGGGRLLLPFDLELRRAVRGVVEAEVGFYCGEAPGPNPSQAAEAFLSLLPPELASTVRLGGAVELRRERTSVPHVWEVLVVLCSGERVLVGEGVGSRSFALLSLASRGLGLGEFWAGPPWRGR